MYKIVLVRHGESQWNKENRFCGWFDAKLTQKGEAEAKAAGESLKAAALEFGHVFTSVLKRAIDTSKIILDVMGSPDVPSSASWRLNERHYGALQGLNKVEVAEKYGQEQVMRWRRSFDVPPPACDLSSEYHPKNDERYQSIPTDELPNGESLKMTIGRTLPYWTSTIVPEVKKGKPVLIVAHGNSLRGLIKYLESVSDADIVELNLPTGVPIIYDLGQDMLPISKKILMDEDELKKRMEAVASQAVRPAQ